MYSTCLKLFSRTNHSTCWAGPCYAGQNMTKKLSAALCQGHLWQIFLRIGIVCRRKCHISEYLYKSSVSHRIHLYRTLNFVSKSSSDVVTQCNCQTAQVHISQHLMPCMLGLWYVPYRINWQPQQLLVGTDHLATFMMTDQRFLMSV